MQSDSLTDILRFLENQVFSFWAEIINYLAYRFGINLSQLGDYAPWVVVGGIALLLVCILFKRYLMWLFNIACIVILFEVLRRFFFV